jgi:ethanolamine utilization protein EutA
MVVNVDIGGGTANAALFSGGSCTGTINFHIGGRLIMLERDGTVTKIHPVIQTWLNGEGLRLREGEQADWLVLQEVALRWGEMLLEVLVTGIEPQACPLVYGQPSIAGGRTEEVAELWVSGGVGALMEQAAPGTIAGAARYGDIGPLLAHGIRQAAKRYAVKLQAAPGAQRATVIGAGVHTLQLSGSTVYAGSHLLPLRNIPVVKLSWPAQAGDGPASIASSVEAAYAEGVRKYSAADQGEVQFAIVIPAFSPCTYPVIRRIAEAVTACSREYRVKPGILICENDIAKALGNCIQLSSHGGLPCVCLDQLTVEHGDYIDIGMPADGGYIPVAVKTLVF